MLDNASREHGGLFARIDVLLEHHELVAAEAGHEIFRPQHGAQAIGDGAEQVVAARMAQRVVDLLELIEVDEQQRREMALPVRHLQQPLDLVAEIDPVGQLRELVIAGQMADAGLRIAPLGDVLEQDDGTAVGHRLEGPRP